MLYNSQKYSEMRYHTAVVTVTVVYRTDPYAIALNKLNKLSIVFLSVVILFYFAADPRSLPLIEN